MATRRHGHGWGGRTGARHAPLGSDAAPTGSDGVRQDGPAGAASLRFRSRAVARIPSVRPRIARFGGSRRRQRALRATGQAARRSSERRRSLRQRGLRQRGLQQRGLRQRGHQHPSARAGPELPRAGRGGDDDGVEGLQSL